MYIKSEKTVQDKIHNIESIIKELNKEKDFNLELVSYNPNTQKFLIVDKDGNTYLSDKNYSLAKIEYGDTPGYFLTDLTYAGELIGKAGETLTSVLDKIKNMLSNFEYYYDINGKFIF